MKDSHFKLNRRSLLKGLGSLPLLFSPLVYSIRSEAQTGTPKRLLLVRLSHGLGGPGGATGTESNFTLSPWFKPFESIKRDCIFIDGLRGTYWGNAHDVSYSHLFTGSVKPGTDSFTTPRSASLDCIVDASLGASVLPVLRLGRDSFLCFDSRLNMLPFERSSISAVNSVIANIATGESASAFVAKKYQRKAILDEANKDIQSLRARVSAAEKNKLDGHLEAIANASRLMGLNTSPKNSSTCTKPNIALTGESYELDLDRNLAAIRAAFLCQLGNVAVLNIDEIPAEQYQWRDPMNNLRRGLPCVGTDFHQCVPHYVGAERRAAYEGSVIWFGEKLVNFANSLKSVTEANGRSVLDNTIIVVCSEIGDGQHDTFQKPFIVMGGSGTPGLNTGRYLRIPTYDDDYVRTPEGDVSLYGKRPISTRTEADLWREIAQAMGASLTTFGSSYDNKGAIGIKA